MNKHLIRSIRILCFVLIAAQIVIAAFFTLPHPEGLRHIKDATLVCETGHFLMRAPLMSLWGLLSRLLHMSAMTFTLKVLPFVVIPACYLAYVYLVFSLCEDRAYVPFTLLLICLLQIFGYQSDAFVSATLLLGWYTGCSLFVHLLLPLLLGILIRRIKKRPVKEREMDALTESEEEWEMKHRYLNARNIGIALIAFIVLSAAAFFVMNRKINNLHAATENLQKAISSKGELIEFKGALGKELKGYVIVGSDGGLSVFLGGTEEDGPALLEQLVKYGQTVDCWYLKENEQGAYEYCKGQGIVVEHVYLIKGIEEVQ